MADEIRSEKEEISGELEGMSAEPCEMSDEKTENINENTSESVSVSEETKATEDSGATEEPENAETTEQINEDKKETYAFRWEYSEQSINDKSIADQKVYKRGRGTLIYAIIMTAAFLVAFAILITSISLDNIGGATNSSQHIGLSVSEIVDIGMPSSFAIFASNGDGSGSMGSGFALTSTGYIMTNYHVVDNAVDLWVVDSNYKEYAASLIGFDKELDIAVLYAENADFKPVTIGDSDKIKLGGEVVAIGCPNGEELMFSVSNGIISGTNRYSGDGRPMLQTNAPLNPGNSGGPLFDENGYVIGVVTSKLTTTTVDDGKAIALEGIAFAVPINDAMKLAEELIKSDLERPMLGVGGVSVEVGKDYFFAFASGYLFPCQKTGDSYFYTNENGEVIQITNAMLTDGTGIFIQADATGVAIVSVTPGLGADGVLEVGDIVTTVAGKTVKSTAEVKAAIAGFVPGDKIDISYYRDGKRYEAKMTLKTKAEMLEAEKNK